MADVFLMVPLSLWVLGGKSTEVKRLLITSPEGHTLSTWLVTDDVGRHCLADVMSVSPTVECLVCPMSHCTLWKEVTLGHTSAFGGQNSYLS